ncbi:Class V chitinase [Cardamine amara subsp. amara]|uniref:Class V chitinase n=1 Tax=Cardamine amara subsp. amara TaxID=228776 RepID=A0ABD0Z648_CARAN
MCQSAVKATYWFPSPNFPATEIDSSHFTHIFCTFADLDPNSYQIIIASWNQSEFHAFTRTVQLRNPSVKTLLSIGGGNADKASYASMASNPNSRRSFIDSSITIARSYGFYGLDLDWEYPTTEVEMILFGTLLQEWRSAIAAESSNTGTPPLLLTAAVYYSPKYQSVMYPVVAVANNLDWVNLMAYDFYGPGWSNVTGPPACLYLPTAGRSGDSGVNEWTKAGLQKTKAVLGFPYYGWAWTLAKPSIHGYDAPTTGPAISHDGEISYRDLKTWITDNRASTVNDPTVVGDYCYAGTTWIGYDSEQTIKTKASYAKRKGLLGYFSWHVGGDDNSELSRAASCAWDEAETE